MPPPEIGEFSGYLQGNYMFLVPYRSSETVDIWRDSVFSMQVTYNLGNNVSLAGDPDSVIFKSPYQLMFSKSALIFAPAAGNQLLYSGEAGGQPFRFVNKWSHRIPSSVPQNAYPRCLACPGKVFWASMSSG